MAQLATTQSDVIARNIAGALDAARPTERPFRHWLLADVLPPDVRAAIVALPVAAATIHDTGGRRETNNDSRVHFGTDNRRRFAVCDRLAHALQDGPAVAAIERACGIDLVGSSLRIEYCQDRDGFWLEPHTDIGVKRLTLLVYLSDDPGGADWGTDLMDEYWFPAGRAPFAANRGLMFVPGVNSWHGFRRRPIQGVRRSIIVN